MEGGLPEPALIDLYLGKQILTTSRQDDRNSITSLMDCAAAVKHYDQLSSKLSSQLQNSFDAFRLCIIGSGSQPEKATLSALDLLHDMVLRLSEDGCQPPSDL